MCGSTLHVNRTSECIFFSLVLFCFFGGGGIFFSFLLTSTLHFPTSGCVHVCKRCVIQSVCQFVQSVCRLIQLLCQLVQSLCRLLESVCRLVKLVSVGLLVGLVALSVGPASLLVGPVIPSIGPVSPSVGIVTANHGWEEYLGLTWMDGSGGSWMPGTVVGPAQMRTKSFSINNSITLAMSLCITLIYNMYHTLKQQTTLLILSRLINPLMRIKTVS